MLLKSKNIYCRDSSVPSQDIGWEERLQNDKLDVKP